MKFFAPFILLVASIGLFVGVINPQYVLLSGNYSDFTETQTIIQNGEKLVSIRGEYDKKFSTIPNETKASLGRLLPDTVDPVRLTIELNSIAARHGIQIKNIKVVPDTTIASKAPKVASASTGAIGPSQAAVTVYGTGSVSFSLSTNSYSAFMGFLRDIERSNRLLDTTLLTIKTGKADTYDIDMSLRTYWLKSQTKS